MRLRQLARATAAAMVLATAFFTNATILGGQQRPAGPFLDSLAEPGEGLAIRGSHARTGRATFAGAVRGGLGVLLRQSAGVPAEERARRFADSYGGTFGVRDRQDLELAGPPRTDALGVEHVRFRQTHLGVPVRGAEFLVHMRGPRVMAANATLADADAMPSSASPTVSAEAAQEEALATVRKHMPERSGDAQLQPIRLEILSRELLTGDSSAPARLAWFVELRGAELREFVWVDAETGAILLDIDQIEQARNRNVYNLNHGTSLPGTLARAEGAAATGDADTDRAYDYSGDTYDYYKNNHNRDSYNNAGAALNSSVHYSTNYANAYWNGAQMVYGDGFAVDDVVGHELTHAVTENTAGLNYANQSGALNESYSDIFGETIDLTNGSGTDTAGVRWLIGEEIGTIRNMMTPTEFSQPGKMSDPQLYCSSGDNGGVHYNSGIPNHAYALMVDGGTYNGQTITGIGLTKAGKVQYRALDTYLTPTSSFLDNYNAINQACTDLIGTAGITANDCTEVNNALLAVEMNAPWGCSPAPPPLCPAGTGTPIYSLQEGFEVASSTFTSSSSSSTQWVRSTLSPNTGSYSEYGANPGSVSDHRLTMTNAVTVPAGGRFYFAHSYSFEPYYDGGVIEYSTDGGSTWIDAGGLIDAGQTYGGVLPSGYSNPLAGRSAFVDATGGYTATRLNLSSLAGQSVKFRFRVGTDIIVSDTGWFVDDIAFYRCGAASPPTLTVAPNPVSPSTALTLTLANGLGGAQDWIALAKEGDPDTTYSSSFFVGSGVTNTVFNKTAPPQAGNYEYRLFQDDGTKLATGAFAVSGNNPAPAITTLNPSSVVAGSAQFTLTVNGSNFVSGASVQFDGNDRITSFGSATQLTATILAGDVISETTHTITVFNPAPGGGTSSGTTLTVTAAPAAPTVTSINPTGIPIASAAQSLTVNGTNFVNTSVVRVNGNARTTTYGSANQLTAALLASDFASAGTLAITVFTPAPGGGTSASTNVTVIGPTLTAAPSPVAARGAMTLTLSNGAGGAQDWIGLYTAGAADTAYQSYFYVGAGVTNTVFNKTAPTQPGNYEYRLFINNGYTRTATAPFTVVIPNPVPAITNLNPSSVVAGSAQFTLTVNGSGFVNGAVVRFDGSDRSTAFGSATQLTATILAGDVASAITHTITVFNPTPGGGTSSGRTLTATSPPAAPTITSISPTGILVGSAAQSLTVNGTNFVNTSVVRVNGNARTTTYGSANQITAALLTGDLANTGTLAITVFTPAPGGGTSNAIDLKVSEPTLTVNKTSSTPGATDVTVTLNNGLGGANDWLAVAKTTDANTTYGPWTYVGAGVTSRTWTPTMPATAGTYEFRLFANNGYTRLATSPPVTLAVTNPVPGITTLNPASVVAGSGPFTLTVNGSNFVNGSIVRFNGNDRSTSFVSANQLTATILAGDIPNATTHTITVFSPAPGGGTSSGSTLTATSPPAAPTITSITPPTRAPGSAQFVLTVIGTNFVNTSVVNVDGSPRSTTYGSGSSLSALIPASDVATAGTLAITVFTPAPGGGTSNAVNLTVISPTLTVNTTTATTGSTSVIVTLTNGLGGGQDWLTVANTSDPNTIYGQWIYVGAGVTTRTWRPVMPTTPGTYEFRLFANNGYTRLATSPVITITAPAATTGQQ